MLSALNTHRFLGLTERINFGLSLAMIGAGGLLWGWTFALASLAMGLATGIINFRLLSWSVRRILGGRNQSMMAIVLGGKLVLLVVTCFVLVVIVDAEIVPLLAGLTVMYLAILAGAMQTMGGEEPAELEG
jgi:hypothetical protein